MTTEGLQQSVDLSSSDANKPCGLGDAEHLGAIPALEANDVILLYRASNRNRRHQRFLQADASPWDLKLDTSPTA
jgi:hypothetical protein